MVNQIILLHKIFYLLLFYTTLYQIAFNKSGFPQNEQFICIP